MTTVLSDDPRYNWKSIEEVSQPIHGLQQCWKDYWWLQHRRTKKIAFWAPTALINHFGSPYYGSPLCNKTKEIAQRLLPTFAGVDVIQVPLVFVPINPRDYC